MFMWKTYIKVTSTISIEEVINNDQAGGKDSLVKVSTCILLNNQTNI